MTLIKTVDTKVGLLRAGDVILFEGDKVTVTGIANRPNGKLRLILDHRSTITLNADDTVDKVVK